MSAGFIFDCFRSGGKEDDEDDEGKGLTALMFVFDLLTFDTLLKIVV